MLCGKETGEPVYRQILGRIIRPGGCFPFILQSFDHCRPFLIEMNMERKNRMFGFRAEGRRYKHKDPIIQATPYFMPQRNDAQVFLQQELDYETLARYIADQSAKGNKITFMQLIIAAYVRGVSQYPEVNRFVMNKQMYSRKEIAVSFALLRDTKDDTIEETTIKLFFDPMDTIYDVVQRVNDALAANRPMEESNFALKFARFMLSVPLLPNAIMGLVKLLDRYGLLPKILIDASPFHAGMWITNMASIGMHSVYHHIYNFGNSSLFLSMGTVDRKACIAPDGKFTRKRVLPVGATADERVCAGAMYARLFALMLHCLSHPEELEIPPAKVNYDPKCEYHVPKPIRPSNEKEISA
jgi:hypothetical protein